MKWMVTAQELILDFFIEFSFARGIYVTGFGINGLIAGLVKIDFFSRKGIWAIP